MGVVSTSMSSTPFHKGVLSNMSGGGRFYFYLGWLVGFAFFLLF